MSSEGKYCDDTYFGCGLSPLIKIGTWFLSSIVVKRFTYIDIGVGMVVLETPIGGVPIQEPVGEQVIKGELSTTIIEES
jgi:hypothetical protein